MNNLHDNNPLVSVIIPVYNTGLYLSQCLDCVVNQTYKNIEIIIIDDGSTDNCPAICDNYASMDNRIKVIHQENSGYGKTCNTGFNIALGEYICIIESDDYAENNMIEYLYNLAINNDLDVARCHFYNFYTDISIQKRIDVANVPLETVILPAQFHNIFFCHPAVWSMLYKRKYLNDNNIRFLETPGASYQDTSFVFKVFACTERFMLTKKALMHYRMDNDNSSSNSSRKLYCVIDEFAEIERFIIEKGIYNKFIYIIPWVKFARYIWNYQRINKKYSWLFLKIFAKEMRRHIREKSINSEIISPYNALKIHIIAYLFPLYHIFRTIKPKIPNESR
ncbi:MAG: glycosyltransferase [Treponema sp.]|nr:glycosyltransferase [Treponema sp.]